MQQAGRQLGWLLLPRAAWCQHVVVLASTTFPPAPLNPQANKAAVGAVFDSQLARQRVCSDAEAEAAVAAAVQRVLNGELQ